MGGWRHGIEVPLIKVENTAAGWRGNMKETEIWKCLLLGLGHPGVFLHCPARPYSICLPHEVPFRPHFLASPFLSLSCSYTSLLAGPQTYQAGSCRRTIAFTVPSASNTFPPDLHRADSLISFLLYSHVR